MTVVEDPYGFDADIGDKLESILQDQQRLRALESGPSDAKSRDDHFATCEKAKRTPEYLELVKSIEEKQAALKCPPTYKELDTADRIARG
jgi:hypothetical protein